MALFKNDGAWVEIDDISIKKEKIISISKSSDLDTVFVKSDNSEGWTLPFSEHGADNSQSDYESYVGFIRGLFSTISGSGGNGGSTTVVNTNRDITTNIVKATSSAGNINKGDFFILETITDENGSKSYDALLSGGGRQLDVPNWEGNISELKPSTSSVKGVVDIGLSSVLLVDENINRKEVIIRNLSNTNVYVSFKNPATIEDAIRIQPDKISVISENIGAIYVIGESVGKISYEETIH